MNAFVYNVQIKRGKWLTPQIVYLTPQIHTWVVMLTPQLPSVISSADTRFCPLASTIARRNWDLLDAL